MTVPPLYRLLPKREKNQVKQAQVFFDTCRLGQHGYIKLKNWTRTDHAVEKGTKQPQKQTTTDCAASSHSFTGSGSVQPTSRFGGAHSDILEILAEVKKTNSKLTEYGERLETLEQRMGSIEQKTKVQNQLRKNRIKKVCMC